MEARAISYGLDSNAFVTHDRQAASRLAALEAVFPRTAASGFYRHAMKESADSAGTAKVSGRGAIAMDMNASWSSESIQVVTPEDEGTRPSPDLSPASFAAYSKSLQWQDKRRAGEKMGAGHGLEPKRLRSIRVNNRDSSGISADP